MLQGRRVEAKSYLHPDSRLEWSASIAATPGFSKKNSAHHKVARDVLTVKDGPDRAAARVFILHSTRCYGFGVRFLMLLGGLMVKALTVWRRLCRLLWIWAQIGTAPQQSRSSGEYSSHQAARLAA